MLFSRSERRIRRHQRVRAKVHGTSERPRLVFRKTNRHLYAEVVDDSPQAGCCVVVCATTNTKLNKASGKKSFSNREQAKILAAGLAQAAKSKGVSKVVFDRGGGIYHGVIKEFAEACRQAGLSF